MYYLLHYCLVHEFHCTFIIILACLLFLFPLIVQVYVFTVFHQQNKKVTVSLFIWMTSVSAIVHHSYMVKCFKVMVYPLN